MIQEAEREPLSFTALINSSSLGRGAYCSFLLFVLNQLRERKTFQAGSKCYKAQKNEEAKQADITIISIDIVLGILLYNMPKM